MCTTNTSLLRGRSGDGLTDMCHPIPPPPPTKAMLLSCFSLGRGTYLDYLVSGLKLGMILKEVRELINTNVSVFLSQNVK